MKLLLDQRKQRLHKDYLLNQEKERKEDLEPMRNAFFLKKKK